MKDTKSEHWCILLIWDLIRDNVIDIIKSAKDINNNYPIVIIDDCVYSGHSMDAILRDLFYKGLDINLSMYYWSERKKIEKYKKSDIINTAICMAPYIVNNAVKILQEYKNVEILCDNYLKTFIESYNDSKYFFNKKISFNDMHYFKACFTDENVTAIYFDHKIADCLSSFYTIYPHIVKELPSRYMIEKMNERYKSYFILS